MTLKYVNREISWLQFNERVLQEADDHHVPPIERMIFLGIFSNNLDEFFRVRVATLNRLISNKNKRDEYDSDPEQTLKEINEYLERIQITFAESYKRNIKLLADNHVFLVDEKQLTKEQQLFVHDYFRDKVRLHLFPLMLDKIGHHIAFREQSIYLAIDLHRSGHKKKQKDHAIIEIPTDKLPRFVTLPEKGGKEYVMFLDDVIRQGLFDIFAPLGYDRFDAYTFKFTRDSEIDTYFDTSTNMMQAIYESVKKRQKGDPVRFVYDETMPDPLLKLLIKQLGVKKKDIIQKGGRYHNHKDLMSFPKHLGHGRLVSEALLPVESKAIPINKNIFEAILQKDILLHYPYQSFQNVIDLLREASIDPCVRKIKMTVYRISRDSAIMNALINAARNGKKVTVYMEFKARFDEENNILWAQRLQEEGVEVLDMVQEMKVHAKLMLFSTKKNGKIIRYALIGTGNPHEETAKIYTDKHLMTANPAITSEVKKVFDFIENPLLRPSFNHLLVSPINMREKFVQLINNEIKAAKKGKSAWIILKMNSLTDRKMIDKLYEASKAGVKIKLLIRGMCGLHPGIKGLSENIEGVSIVDKYLEHARLFVFSNQENPLYYMGSADWMPRNLDFRIEAITPVLDPEIKKDLQQILDFQLMDNTHARIINPDFPNQYKRIPKNKKYRSQSMIYDYFKKLNKIS